MSLNKKLLEQLFLIEFLVHKVKVRDKEKCDPECKCKKHSKQKHVPLRVRVKFINFPCVEINQEEFGKKEEEEDPGEFSSGKSFLFPMAPLDLIRAIQHFPLAITVIKKPKANKPPDVLGVTQVRLCEEMSHTIRRAAICNEQLPISSDMKDAYDLIDLNGEYVGYIVFFIRLSCFGQSITTQFQSMDKRSYLFKNTVPDEPYFCECVENIDDEPGANDIIPNPPLVCTSQELMDIPCCGDAGIIDQIENRPVPWKMLNASEPPVPKSDNMFVGKASDIHANKFAGMKPCPCSGLRGSLAGNAASKIDVTYSKKQGKEKLSENDLQDLIPFDAETTDMDNLDDYLKNEPGAVLVEETVEAKTYIPPPTVQYSRTSKENVVGHVEQPKLEPEAQSLPKSPDSPRVPEPISSPKRPEEPPQPTAYPDTPRSALPSVPEESEVILEPSQSPPSVGDYTRRRSSKLKRRFRKSSKYVYSLGNHYPGIKFGHKACVESAIRVPQNKGWLWNDRVCDYGCKPRPGWRPGAIGQSLSDKIRSADVAVPPLTATQKKTPRPSSRSGVVRRRGSKTSSGPFLYNSELVPITIPEVTEPMPTLHIHRRNGAYFVAMHPPGLSGDTDNVPLQFRIPSKKKAKKKQQHRKTTSDDGEESEGTDADKADEVSSTSSSELDIEFFTPGAFEPPPEPVQLASTLTQLYEADLPPRVSLDLPMGGDAPQKGRAPSVKGKGKDKKAKKGKKSLAESLEARLADIDARSKTIQVDLDVEGVGARKKDKIAKFIERIKQQQQAKRNIQWEDTNPPAADADGPTAPPTEDPKPSVNQSLSIPAK